MSNFKPVRIYCLKYGEQYQHYHVNALYNQLIKNTTFEFDMWCITDNVDGIDERITTIKFDSPTFGGNPYFKSFNKVRIYNEELNSDFTGKVLYFDLDVIIHNNVDFLLEDIYYGGVTTICCSWVHKTNYYNKKL